MIYRPLLILKKIFFLFLLLANVFSCQKKPKGPSSSVVKFVNGYIKVVQASGGIYYWPPMGTHWLTLSVNRSIPLGSMVQLEGGSDLRIQFVQAYKSGWKGKSVQINVKIPICMRLDKDLIRKVKFSEEYISDLSSLNLGKIDGSTPVSEKYDFEFSWKRVMSLIQPTEANKQKIASLYQNAKQDGFEVGMVLGKINIISPTNADSYFYTDYPVSFDIVWEKIKEKNPIYKVYVWKFTEKKPEYATGISRDHFYQTVIHQAGSYYIQVSDSANKYMSTPHLVHFSSPKILSISKRAKLKEENKYNLVYPHSYSMFFTDKRQEKVNFSWTVSPKNTLTKSALYLKKLAPELANTKESDENSRKVEQENISMHSLGDKSSSIQISLSPGRYIWWLQGYVEGDLFKGKVVKIVSDERIFEIAQKRKNSSINFAEIIRNNNFKTIYVTKD